MKIYLTKPRYHWLSPYTILEYIFFWKSWSGVFKKKSYVYDDDYNVYPEWVEKWSDRLLPLSKAACWCLDKIHPEVKYVKIDYWDTWSMDCTLSPIILPMLKQLQETKHGAPFVDDEDVPLNLQSISAPPKENEWDTDSNHFLRWDWVMNEMIWTFEQLSNWDSESKFFDHSESDRTVSNLNLSKIKVDEEGLKAHNDRINNGLRMFGKYYRNLWD